VKPIKKAVHLPQSNKFVTVMELDTPIIPVKLVVGAVMVLALKHSIQASLLTE